MMSTVMVIVCVMPPPVAVMVIVSFPVDALLLALTVKVALPLPGAIMELGPNVTVSPLRCPETDRAIAELNLPDTFVITVEVPDFFRATDNDVGEAERMKVEDVAAGARALISPVPFGVPQPVTRS